MALESPNTIVISRSITAERMLNCFLFVFILHLVVTVLAFVVLFQLVYSLITMGPPIARVTRFADRITRYSFEIFQYMTYNNEHSPFPFKDLPTESEAPLGNGAAI
jgi:hypothetical protein